LLEKHSHGYFIKIGYAQIHKYKYKYLLELNARTNVVKLRICFIKPNATLFEYIKSEGMLNHWSELSHTSYVCRCG